MENNNNNFYYVMHYDYEDPDWSDIMFIGLSEDECYEYIDAYFEDYYEDEWDEEEDGIFKAKEMGKDWLKAELHLEIKSGLEVTKSESFINLINV